MDELEAIIETSAVSAVELAASAMAERGHEVHPCPNCGKPLIGAYCAVCGQERDTHRRSVWGLVRLLIIDVVSFDSRILRTGTALVAQPGEIACAFREGRTRRYVPALRLYLFVSLIFFVILGATNLAIMQLEVVATPAKLIWENGKAYMNNPAYDPDDEDVKKYVPQRMEVTPEKARKGMFNYSTKIYFFAPIGAHHTNLSREARDRLTKAEINIDIDDSKMSKEQQAGIKKVKETKNWFERHFFDGMNRLAADPAALNGPLTTWIPRVLFFLMPLYALLLSLFYIRQRKTFYYVDHLIFSLTIHTFGFVLLLVAAAAAQFFAGEAVALGTMIVAAIYTLIATRTFYRQNWFWTVVKFAFVTFFYTCFFLIPALVGVLALSFFGVS